MTELTEIEKRILSKFLKDLGERMGNAGCNDFSLPNTPENKEFMQKVVEFAKVDDEEFPDLYDKGKELITYDFLVLDYLIDRLGLYDKNKTTC